MATAGGVRFKNGEPLPYTPCVWEWACEPRRLTIRVKQGEVKVESPAERMVLEFTACVERARSKQFNRPAECLVLLESTMAAINQEANKLFPLPYLK